MSLNILRQDAAVSSHDSLFLMEGLAYKSLLNLMCSIGTSSKWCHNINSENSCNNKYFYSPFTLLPPPKKEAMFLVRSVCLFVCLSVGLLANLWTDFDEIFCRGRAWLKDQVINFGGDPDHASDPGIQSPKSGSSGLPCSVEVCALWAYLVFIMCQYYFPEGKPLKAVIN